MVDSSIESEAYGRAEARIESARLRQLQELTLEGTLYSLPDSLRHLKWLRSLNLAYTSVTLPEWFVELRQLTSLNLAHNYLRLIPTEVSALTNLESLNLDGNSLTDIPEWISSFPRLHSLVLSNNQLTLIPEQLGELGNLKLLNVFNNQIRALPDSVGQLSALEKLNLTANMISALPETIGRLSKLHSLDLKANVIAALPESIGHLRELEALDLSYNRILSLPDALTECSQLQSLNLSFNQLKALPASLGQLTKLTTLDVRNNQISTLPESIGEITNLRTLVLFNNQLADVPTSLGHIDKLREFTLHHNPLNPELESAYYEGFSAVQRYLNARAFAEVVLNEAKLILVGEGEVGKSCLLGALRGDAWQDDRPTTHGIEIKPVSLVDPVSGTQITLNGWDFGGQRVYRPTHQLFFSAPAVYLVVWKPREGPQQGFVKEWIKLIQHREPDAKILVVATHGGPGERRPDIDRQELWDMFGKEMVVDFFLVDSKPTVGTGERKGIAELKRAIATVAANLPEMGRRIPRRWAAVRQRLQSMSQAYLALEQVLDECRKFAMDQDEARDFLRISHRLGHFIHYEHDPALREIVILKPDWLATAISFVLDDKQTRESHGLAEFRRLAQLWNDPARPVEFRYDAALHPLFLRLMERFDLSYKVAIPSEPEDAVSFWQRVKGLFGSVTVSSNNPSQLQYTSLIAQLVPDIRPEPISGWSDQRAVGDEERVQICRITEAESRQSATAEGLFFQLIVRLHKFSLGRVNYADSVHWQRGLVLEDDYGARALLEYVVNDVRITVRSPYPERFLAALTYEVKWLVENFWAGLRCDVMVPCLSLLPCIGLFEVRKLLENKKRGRPDQPCPICNEWQSIEELLHNAPAGRPSPLEELLNNSGSVTRALNDIRLQLSDQRIELLGRFDRLDASSKELVSKVEDAYSGLMHTLLDEAKDGPRLFSFEPIEPRFFEKPKWVSGRFRITLWCEHSRLPLPQLNAKGDKRGVYDLTLPRDWIIKAAPFLKILAGTLSLILPVATSGTKLLLDDASFKGIEKQLDFGQKSLDSLIKGGQQAGSWLAESGAPELEDGEAIMGHSALLRQLHAWLRENDPSFGGLVRVQNKRQEFLWVHQQFEQEY